MDFILNAAQKESEGRIERLVRLRRVLERELFRNAFLRRGFGGGFDRLLGGRFLNGGLLYRFFRGLFRRFLYGLLNGFLGRLSRRLFARGRAFRGADLEEFERALKGELLRI